MDINYEDSTLTQAIRDFSSYLSDLVLLSYLIEFS